MTFCFKGVWQWLDQSKVLRFSIWISALVWLVAAVPFLSLYNDGVSPVFSSQNKGSQDLANYYMAGSVVLAGDFNSLYPVPKENIRHNAGWPDCSDRKQKYIELAQRKGVEDSFRFILPPPSALLFVPFGLIPYSVERWVWVSFLGLCCWGACLLAYCMGRRCNCSQRTSMIVFTFWAFSPLVLKALRTANSTPLLAVSIGLAAMSIFENRRTSAVISCITAGLLKGTSIIFVPLILLMKHWGIVLWGGVAAVFINGITIALGGWSAYIEFFEKIYPTTQRTSPYFDNQSIPGLFYRVFGESTLQPEFAGALKLSGVLCMAAMILLIYIRRKGLAENRIKFTSATVALLGLHLIFRPYNWGHYALCYIPFWGVLLAGIKNITGKVVLWITAILLWCPLITFHGKTLISIEPFASYILAGEIMVIFLAVIIFVKQPNGIGDSNL